MKTNNTLFAIILVFLALILSPVVYAEGSGVFLCMRAEDSVALYSDGESDLEYINMIASNGAKVTPMISVNGNTYLPFRFVCEISGLKDAQDSVGNLKDGYFRFTDKDGVQTIEINYNNKYVAHQVGIEFSYEVTAGDIREVSIYNINGSLYFPITYMAKLTGASTFWNEYTRDIVYVSANISAYKFIDDRVYIHPHLLYKNGYFSGYNNLNANSLYLKSDGMTVADLSNEVSDNIICTTKTNGLIFYLTDSGDIKYKQENNYDIKTLGFRAETIITVKNKLYGIERDTKKGFVSNLDGSGFKYITDRAIFNLIVRQYDNEFYLYYGEYENRSKIHMISIKTMDNYEVEITDYNHNSLINDVEKFVVGTNMFAFIDTDSHLHTITLNDPLEKFEIALIDEKDHKIHIQSEDGTVLSNISNINYNTKNNILFMSQNIENSALFYSLDANSVKKSDIHKLNGLSLFEDLKNATIMATYNNGELVTEYIYY